LPRQIAADVEDIQRVHREGEEAQDELDGQWRE
jgi:hypothetical protein